GEVTQRRLARLNADGSVDGGFQSPFNITFATPILNSVEPLPDGRIIIAGGYFDISPGFTNLICLNSNGSIDPTFSTGAATFTWVATRAYPQFDAENNLTGVVIADGGDNLR